MNENKTNDDALAAAMAGETKLHEPRSGDDLETRVAELEGELKRASNEVLNKQNEALKAQAEFENFRKRMRREMEEESRYAALPLIRELLPVIDNLERAIQAAEQTGASGGLLEGVKLVVQQLDAALAKNGCVKIESLGQEFDPHLHMALLQEPSEYESGKVSRVMQSGYKMHDRIVRPAQVFVSTGPASS